MPQKKSLTRYIRFTNTACREATAPIDAGSRVFYYFERYRGLTLRVSSDGERAFYIIQRHGKQVYRYKLAKLTELMTDGKLDIDLVIPKLEAQRRLITDGLDPKLERAKETAKGMTYGELFNKYITDAERNEKKSIRKMQYAHNRYFQDFVNTAVAEITQDEVKAWVKRLEDGGYAVISNTDSKAGVKKQRGRRSGKQTTNSNHKFKRHTDGKSTARKNYAQLRAVLHWGTKERLIKLSDDPTYGVRLPKTKTRDRFLLPGEYQRFMNAVETEPNEKMRDFFRILLYTGARLSNVLAMRWDEIHLDLQTWEIPDSKSKNAEAITIPLSLEALEVLRRRYDQQIDLDWVFPGYKTGSHLSDPKWYWKRLLKRAEITNLRIHDIRRTVGSYMAISGASLPIIGKQLGHKSVNATAIYGRLTLDPVREALGRARQAMEQAAAASKNAEVVPMTKAV